MEKKFSKKEIEILKDCVQICLAVNDWDNLGDFKNPKDKEISLYVILNKLNKL